ncbi:hypothetical protein BGZ61DRAFT_462199 [Ilyonectria robusta]|uniref:uncharacterized protein n=1 Tax=Ilyonectria robusta TaxID=1079257 RepID=UPI001E8EF450|nr:uncharacterized protein BGZ61DRAFT_462199 [Ilyonectria robusta]KAH8665364.1 hypothetical protein BGZ61DRAFT_462199 [Ilyonectria robusta]
MGRLTVGRLIVLLTWWALVVPLGSTVSLRSPVRSLVLSLRRGSVRCLPVLTLGRLIVPLALWGILTLRRLIIPLRRLSLRGILATMRRLVRLVLSVGRLLIRRLAPLRWLSGGDLIPLVLCIALLVLLLVRLLLTVGLLAVRRLTGLSRSSLIVRGAARTGRRRLTRRIALWGTSGRRIGLSVVGLLRVHDLRSEDVLEIEDEKGSETKWRDERGVLDGQTA